MVDADIDAPPPARERFNDDAIVTNLEALASAVARDRVQRIADVTELFASLRLGPSDPLVQDWCVFRGTGAVEEPTYTQWLSRLLGTPMPNREIAMRTWNALTRVILRSRPPGDGGALRDLLARIPEPEAVRAEYSAKVSANEKQHTVRPDIIVEEPDRLVVLELKLWGSWNPGAASGEDQATLYGLFAADRQPDPAKRALVIMGVHEVAASAWTSIRWCDFAAELRVELERLVVANSHLPAAAFPMLALVVGIEQHLLELRAPDPARGTGWGEYRNALALAAHLGRFRKGSGG